MVPEYPFVCADTRVREAWSIRDDSWMPRPRRFHVDIPPVTTLAAGHRVTFVGATFHSRSVMIEYDVDPPISRDENPFGPLILGLVAVDDAGSGVYATEWQDFDWRGRPPGRMTTRLERRPPAEATRLTVSVRTLEEPTPGGYRYAAPSDQELIVFDIVLPAEHHVMSRSADAG